jgi:hypothetical protein
VDERDMNTVEFEELFRDVPVEVGRLPSDELLRRSRGDPQAFGPVGSLEFDRIAGPNLQLPRECRPQHDLASAQPGENIDGAAPDQV